MDRLSPQYQERKMAWELTRSKTWQVFLKPLLERKVHQFSRKEIGKLDDAFQVCKDHAEVNYARFLLATIELKAKEFEATAMNAVPDA